MTADGKRRVRVVIQARTSSSRLPGKVLLPIGGVQIATLIARRFQRFGMDVVVATSDDRTDDILALELERANVPLIRGDLRNVLGRYGKATADMTDEDICVRITADNVFPDGRFVGSLLEEFEQGGADYLNSSNRLPYGLAAEIFTLRALRDAVAEAVDEYDIEHVPPWIKRNRVCRMSDNDLGRGELRHLRCTVDTLQDYVATARLLQGFDDPVTADFEALVEALITADQRRTSNASGGAPFVLGTAQLGMSYGRANAVGKPTADQAVAMVRAATEAGVRTFDTARAYGDSERMLGLARQALPNAELDLITKLSPLGGLDEAATETTVRDRVRASIYRSLHELRVRALPVVLLHRAAQLDQNGGLIWDELKRMKTEGLINKLGASVQTPDELATALERTGVEHVQLPFNLLDGRWDKVAAGAGPGVTIHVRSAYLQGLLVTADASMWPRVEGVDPGPMIREMDALVEQFGRESRQDLCLAFVRGASWVDGVVVGAETLDQLTENVRLFQRPPLSPDQQAVVRETFPDMPERLLNPALWS